MSMFEPEGSQGQQAPGQVSLTPASPNVTQEDVALMQRVLNAAAQNPNLIPDQFMAYALDYVQASNLVIPIGQVFGYQKIAPQVITDFAQVPAPVDGQIVLLKLGNSAPFTYVQMMYDQKAAQWASETFPIGGGAVSYAGTGFQSYGGFTAMPWSPVVNAGLIMQLKWAGTLENEASTATAQVLAVWVTAGSSFTSTTLMSATSAGDAVTRAVGVDWTTLTSPGSYDLVVIGMQANRAGAGTTVAQTGIVGRFIK